MPRRAGSTTENSYAFQSQIIALHSEGKGRNEIARQLGVSGPYVGLTIKKFSHKTVSPATLLDWCMTFKAQHKHIGADYVRYECQKHFEALYGKETKFDIPSAGKLEQLYEQRKLTTMKLGGRKDKRAYHNFATPERHGDKYECDLHGPLMIGGRAYQVFAMIDVISRIVWAELLPANFVEYLPWAVERSFTALGGAPTELQSDNGIGFVRPGRKSVSDYAQHAWNLGAERIHYIPEGQPQRNGHIERWNRTLEDSFLLRYDLSDMHITDARATLEAWIIEYNTERPHSALKRTAPALHGTFTTPTSQEPESITVQAEQSGQLAYTRHIDPRGIATVCSPLEFYIMGRGLCGTYISICIDWTTKAGTIRHRHAQIGTFTHTSEKSYKPDLDATKVNSIEGRDYDELAQLREQSKRRKKKITEYPGDYGLRTNEDGLEELYVKKTGKTFLTAESLDADHLTDLGIIVQ